MNITELNIKYKIKKSKKYNNISNITNTGGDSLKLGYTKIYDKYFETYKNKKINLLEIGIFKGDSLFIYDKYFSQINLFGLDINLDFIKNKYQEKDFINKLTLYNLDSTNSNDTSKITDKFDIIIDDANHNPGSVIKTLLNFKDKLNKDGIYFIEDVGNNGHKNVRRRKIKNLLNVNNIKFIYK